jgi:glyoxylase-like metal-dependent hydrolase (beta-lactamase superfamily II)
MEILPGIHQVPSLKWNNAYLVVEEAGLTLVDAGLPGAWKQIFSYIDRINRSPSELIRVIVTHSHPDHTGPLKKLSQMTGAKIMAHSADTRCEGKTESNWLHYPAQPPTFGWNVPLLHRIPAHELIEDGQILPVMGGLQVLHTPGHTPGSVCLYLEDHKLLFTGDTLLADGHCFRRPVPFPGTNFRDYRASVERLAQLSFETACVGHGKPLRQAGTAALRDMLDNYSWMAPWWNWLKRRMAPLLGR